MSLLIVDGFSAGTARLLPYGEAEPPLTFVRSPAIGIFCKRAFTGGGCPTGLLNGGTSGGAPTWAAFQAILNQSVGQNLGFVNPTYYNFANTSAFHNAGSMNSTFAQVGLGSPDLDALHLLLCGQTPGSPDAAQSEALPLANGVLVQGGLPIPADGQAQGGVKVILRDAKGNTVSGQPVTLSASSSNVQISPSSGMSSADNGAVVFTVTDKTPETVTFTAATGAITQRQ